MTTLEITLLIWAGIACLFWVFAYTHHLLQLSRLRFLGDLEPPEPEEWPRLSVLVPARNEEARLETALTSLRDQDYPNLEIVVVDDRSTDRTGEIIDDMAAQDPRIRAVHVDELPDGWLGKMHALERAADRATGDWFLLTDADVEYAPGALRRSVSYALSEDADQLCCVPHIRASSFFHEVCLDAFLVGMLGLTNVKKIEDPARDGFLGVGAFNLVRRDTFERAGGFEALRMEVADDVGLGYIIDQVDGRSRVALAPSLMQLTWYDSLGDQIRGVEKNAFGAIAQYSYLRLLFAMALAVVVTTGPFVAVALPSLGLWPAGLAIILCNPIIQIISAERFRRSIGPFLALPFGQVISLFALVRSAWKCWRQGGITWRGTLYSVEELRSRQIVKL